MEYQHTFFGYQCYEWICEYTTALSSEEAEQIASEFLLYGWIHQVMDKSDRGSHRSDDATFKYGKKTMYYLTEKGRSVLDWKDNDSIKSDHSTNSISSSTVDLKSQHANRLLPTTAVQEAKGVPKATVNQQSESAGTSVNENEETMRTEGDEGCTFGFTPATKGKLVDTSIPDEIKKDGTNKVLIDDEDDAEDHMSEQMIQLRLSNKLKENKENMLLRALPDLPQSEKLQGILQDALVRMYFRQYLRANFCEENINFWMDFRALRQKIAAEKSELTPTFCHSLLTECCIIYYNYICPEKSPVELNIDHSLRIEMTDLIKSVLPDPNKLASKNNNTNNENNKPFGSISSCYSTEPMLEQTFVIRTPDPQHTLKRAIDLLSKVNQHVFRMMAQDSVPRFLKSEKYKELLELHSFYVNHHEPNTICPTSLQRAAPPKSH
jgi:hypothetical protein